MLKTLLKSAVVIVSLYGINLAMAAETSAANDKTKLETISPARGHHDECPTHKDGKKCDHKNGEPCPHHHDEKNHHADKHHGNHPEKCDHEKRPG